MNSLGRLSFPVLTDAIRMRRSCWFRPLLSAPRATDSSDKSEHSKDSKHEETIIHQNNGPIGSRYAVRSFAQISLHGNDDIAGDVRRWYRHGTRCGFTRDTENRAGGYRQPMQRLP